MNTKCWILLGATLFSIILFIVFSLIKKAKIVQNISSILPLPLIFVLNFIFLKSFIPDSFHTITLSSIALIFISISYIMHVFFNNKAGKVIAGIIFVFSIIFWCLLYKSVFYIYHVPSLINIIAASAYFILFLLFFIIFIKQQSFTFYLFTVLSACIISFLHYSTIIYLCYNPVNFNIIKAVGTTLLLGYFILSILTNYKFEIKQHKLICFFLLFTSQVLIAFSNLMVLY